MTRLRSLGLHVVDHPRTPTSSITGRGICPDLGLRLGTGGPTLPTPDGPIDVIGEVKVQHAPGTATDKLTESIERYARLSDLHGVPAVIFHDLDRALDAVELDRWTTLATNRGVGFVRLDEVTAPGLRTLVTTLVTARAVLPGPDHLRHLVAAYGLATLTAAVRQGEQDQLAGHHAPTDAALTTLLW